MGRAIINAHNDNGQRCQHQSFQQQSASRGAYHVTFQSKVHPGVNGKSECYKKGSLNRELGDLPLPKDDYYYSPNSMANILSLAMISKTNRVYMDTAIDNAFYVFDGEGKYLRFHLCHSTNLYRLDIEQTNDGATIFTTIEGCETTKQHRD